MSNKAAKETTDQPEIPIDSTVNELLTALHDVRSTALFGVVLRPQFVTGPVMSGDAAQTQSGWLCNSRIETRYAQVVSKDAAVRWLREWCGADVIIEGCMYQ